VLERSDEDRCCVCALDVACACGVAWVDLANSLSEAPFVWLMERVAKAMQETETPHDHDQHTQWAGVQTGANQV